MDGLPLGLSIVFTPWAFFYCVLGTVLGIAVGAIPGLTGAMLIALTLPLTYYMTPTDAVVLLIAMYVGAITGGLITATLFRMPGTPSNVMTTFDGYPLAKSGRPGRALGLGISASFVGGIISWFFLFLLAKPLSIWATLMTSSSDAATCEPRCSLSAEPNRCTKLTVPSLAFSPSPGACSRNACPTSTAGTFCCRSRCWSTTWCAA